MFVRQDEENKEETAGIYVDMDMAEAEVRATIDMGGTTSTWKLANNNRKRIEKLEKEVGQIWTLIVFGMITLTLFVILVVLIREGII